jgi:hypothetical protein
MLGADDGYFVIYENRRCDNSQRLESFLFLKVLRLENFENFERLKTLRD